MIVEEIRKAKGPRRSTSQDELEMSQSEDEISENKNRNAKS